MKLWIDSSVAYKPGTLHSICKLATTRRVELVVHPHVHLEMCRRLRCQFGPRYSPSYMTSFLEQLRISISTMLLDRTVAERWAGHLHGRFPTDEDWESAKHSTLGGELRADFTHLPGRMPMTTDWWVALQVHEATEDRIVVDDQGGEWAALRGAGRALTAAEALAWLDKLSSPLPGG